MNQNEVRTGEPQRIGEIIWEVLDEIKERMVRADSDGSKNLSQIDNATLW